MKMLLTLDEKDYTDDMQVFEKHTVRAIIEKDGKYSMQRSGKGEYKIPGGGVEGGETHLQTLIREVEEEVGLVIIPESVQPIGEILELREDKMCKGQKYVCHSYFYKCKVEDKQVPTRMTASELEKGFQPVWEKLSRIVDNNDKVIKEKWLKRDTEFLRLMLEGKVICE